MLFSPYPVVAAKSAFRKEHEGHTLVVTMDPILNDENLETSNFREHTHCEDCDATQSFVWLGLLGIYQNMR